MSSLLVGRKAPGFSTKAVSKGQLMDCNLHDYLGKYVVLFFYPLDFTFVCPTELHAFQAKKEEFEQRGAELMGCSIDSGYSHLAWLNTPRSKGGIEGIEYLLLSDLNKTISKEYQVLDEKEGIAYRGLFIIDPEGIICHQVVNDLPIGRSVEETLRVLDAIIFHKEYGEVCPANWVPGKKGMQTTQEGLVHFFEETSSQKS